MKNKKKNTFESTSKRIFICAEYYTECIREPHEDDGWDEGDYEDTLVEVGPVYISEKGKGYTSHEIYYGNSIDNYPWLETAKDLTPVWVVVARYGSGSTFGHHSGRFAFHFIAESLEKAEKWRKENERMIEELHESYFGGVYTEIYGTYFHKEEKIKSKPYFR